MKPLLVLGLCLAASSAGAQAITVANGANVAEGSTAAAPYAGGGTPPPLVAALKGIQIGLAALNNTTPQPVKGTGSTVTNLSGTVATGGTFQTLAAANAARKTCYVSNPANASEVLFVFVYDGVASETTGHSISLAAGKSWDASLGGGATVLSNRIDVTATTSTHAFNAGCG